jgi:ABC-2 type transport system ATP-binding protein
MTSSNIMEPVISLHDLTKDYGQLRALDEVSLTIDRGVTGLLGPNGAGKSTLIKIILGLVKLTRGSGTVLGYSLTAQSRAIRSRVGYMPEDDCYIGGLTGIQMMRFSARLSRLPSVEALRRSHEILDFCGIEQERYRLVETYSTGMRQKLKFAQAIAHDPQILILDEPTSGLDPEERQAMLNRIRVLAQRSGKTVLISTHILPDVQSLCDSVVILARGRVRVSERLEVLSRPASPTYRLRVIGDGAKLAARLSEQGIAVNSETDRSMTLSGVDVAGAERIWAWACEAGVGIHSLLPARNSLEQIFFEAVQEKRDADS